VLFAALVTEVLLSMLISLGVGWASFVRTGSVQTMNWVVPVIILFPLLVYVPPRTMITASILCALTMPVGFAILELAGRIDVHLSDYLAATLTAAVAVGISSIASRTVYGAGRQIAAARRIGSYELMEVIGQGGMGEVWRARHLLLARRAAVKLILAERLQGAREARESALERFTREAQVTAELSSPHTVELYDFGVSADGSLYYVMELLQGINAENFIHEFGPVEPRRAVFLLLQACHSLGEAHARGLIHRDVKPSNIYICRYGRDADFVKVLDFGLSKPILPDRAPRLTAEGVQVGTPGYMAPEQIFGLAMDPATDLYALGCVAYWLMAGAKPFEGDTVGELMRQHAQSPPPPLATRAPHPVPPRLEELVMTCLSKDPARRPRDADALRRELEACVGDRPWSHAEAERWWDEHAPAPAAPVPEGSPAAATVTTTRTRPTAR
jgi:serine/threonine-protein kinase